MRLHRIENTLFAKDICHFFVLHNITIKYGIDICFQVFLSYFQDNYARPICQSYFQQDNYCIKVTRIYKHNERIRFEQKCKRRNIYVVYKSILRTRNSCQKLFPTFTCDVDFGFARLGFCSGMKIFRKLEVCVVIGIKVKHSWDS